MSEKETIRLLRDCEAVQIPAGLKIVLPKGTKVKITQSLGGAYTVMSETGYMLQIQAANAEALGIDPKEQAPETKETKDIPLKDQVWNQMKTCFDPEIPVNIVDLGLIYECKIEPLEEAGKHKVSVKMTLTAPGCGMGDSIRMDLVQKLESIPDIKEVDAELVWEPQWDRSMMSEAAKLQLGVME